MKDLIKALTEAFGPSGYEKAVREIIQKEVKKVADSLEVDALGSLHAVKKGDGSGLKIMLAAHMDEIGLMISHIEDNGFARLVPLGGVQPDTLVGNRARFTNGAVGVINVDNWLLHGKIDTIRKLYVDFGVRDKKDVPVQVGDVAGFQRPFVELGDTLLAKSMDDRIGCTVLVETLRQLKQTPHDVHFIFTVQEELPGATPRGALTAAYKVQPDVSIAVDVTDSGDLPGRKHFPVKMGQGPAIKVKDAGMIAHPGLKNWMIETAKKNKIPYQSEILGFGTTDAQSMQLVGEGSAAGRCRSLVATCIPLQRWSAIAMCRTRLSCWWRCSPVRLSWARIFAISYERVG